MAFQEQTHGFSPGHPAARARRDLRVVPSGPCPEIDCLRDRLPPHTIAAAEERARTLGVGADEVLIAHGIVTEDEYVAALAASLGTSVDPLDLATRMACPFDGSKLIEGIRNGSLPQQVGSERSYIFSPRGIHARLMVQYLTLNREVSARPRLASPRRMRRFVTHHGAADYGRIAADRLKTEHPEFSAANDRPLRTRIALAVAAMAFIAAMVALLSLVFLGWIMLRLTSVFIAPPHHRRRAIPLDELPVYTVIVPLYREARAVPDLIASLRALDYPGLR